MVSKKELNEFLKSQGIIPLRKPRKISLESISKSVEKHGFALTKHGKSILSRNLKMLKKEGIAEAMILGEKWRKRKELKIETRQKGILGSSYLIYVPLKKQRKKRRR